MKVVIRRHLPLEKLLEEVRRVPLKRKEGSTEPVIFPYEKARITLREMFPFELNPGSKYVLQRSFEFQRELRETLMRDHGIDPFQLEGGYEIENESGELMTLIPPIIEVSEETMKYVDTRGDLPYDHPVQIKMNIIVDGLHRIYLARLFDHPVNVLHIQGVPSEYPFYALANQWADIKITQKVPEKPEEKKDYRRKDSYGLYRDFGVLGCGAPRPVGT